MAHVQAPAASMPITVPTVEPATGGEADLDRCLAEIAVKRRRLAELEGDLARLRQALARFEVVCQSRVGDLLADLRHVGDAIARHRSKLERLRRDLGLSSPSPSGNGAGPAADLTGEGWTASADQPEPAAPTPIRPDDEAEAKRLYRDLAKRCHPDFAQDADERARRELRMLEINDAYRRRDLAALRSLRHEVEGDEAAFGERPLAERLAWALTELQRLDAVLATQRAEWMHLRRSDLHKLWKRHEAGEAVFDDLRDDLEKQLDAEADRLDRVIAAYRDLADEHPDASGVVAAQS